MPVNLVFQMIVWNGDYVLKECLESILPYGKVVVSEGPVSYFAKQGHGTSSDSTNRILRELIGPENVVHDVFSEKDAMMHATEHLIPSDTQFVWMVDSDEIWKSEDIERIIDILYNGNIDGMSFKPYSLYGGFNRYIGGLEREFEWHRIQRWYPGATWATHRPPTVNAPDGKPWSEHKYLHHNDTDLMGLNFYHYSHVFASQVARKTEYYAARGGCIENYMNDVWLPWVTGNDKQKEVVENKFNGVQEWKPDRRGEARTRIFVEQHPKVIRDAMPRLRKRFDDELKQWIKSS